MNTIINLVNSSYSGNRFIIKNVKFEEGLLKCNLYSTVEEDIKIDTNKIDISISIYVSIKNLCLYPVNNPKNLTFIIDKITHKNPLSDINIYKEIIKKDPINTKYLVSSKLTNIKELEEIDNMKLVYNINLKLDLSNIKCYSIELKNFEGLDNYINLKNKLPQYKVLIFDLYLDNYFQYKYVYEIVSNAEELNLLIINGICDIKYYSDENLIYLYKILNLKKDYEEGTTSNPINKNKAYINFIQIFNSFEVVLNEIENRNLTGYIFRQKSAR